MQSASPRCGLRSDEGFQWSQIAEQRCGPDHQRAPNRNQHVESLTTWLLQISADPHSGLRLVPRYRHSVEAKLFDLPVRTSEVARVDPFEILRQLADHLCNSRSGVGSRIFLQPFRWVSRKYRTVAVAMIRTGSCARTRALAASATIGSHTVQQRHLSRTSEIWMSTARFDETLLLSETLALRSPPTPQPTGSAR